MAVAVTAVFTQFKMPLTEVDKLICGGCDTTADAVTVPDPLAPVTVTVYVPAVRLTAVAVDWLLDQW